MNWFTGVVVYFLVWWLVIFTTLSWGLRHDETKPKGVPSTAPDKTHLLKKVIWCSAISAVIWLVIYFLVTSDLISFRRMVES